MRGIKASHFLFSSSFSKTIQTKFKIANKKTVILLYCYEKGWGRFKSATTINRTSEFLESLLEKIVKS